MFRQNYFQINYTINNNYTMQISSSKKVKSPYTSYIMHIT